MKILVTCFIIMGFNTKTMEDGKEYNLNLSYEEIIKPVLEQLNIQYIRADEIMLSEIIDESMYRLLLCADLVIADITTLNPNALYELGVRYALKPYATVLIGDRDTKFPFDISHLRIFTYEHSGKTITSKECDRMKKTLQSVIENIRLCTKIDSPVYRYIEGLTPPFCPSDTSYFATVTKRFKASDNLCNLVNLAYSKRDEGDFSSAIQYYKRALAISKDDYIVKEIAVCTYQSETRAAYIEALRFLKENVDVNTTTNPEILKTLGTIYKKLWIEFKTMEYAQQALTYYERSFILYEAYNSGLNYGLMLFVIASYQKEQLERDTYALWAKNIYNKTKEICLSKYDINDYWVNASLEECSVALDDNESYRKYRDLANTAILLMPESMKWKRKKTDQQVKILQNIMNQLAAQSTI